MSVLSVPVSPTIGDGGKRTAQETGIQQSKSRGFARGAVGLSSIVLLMLGIFFYGDVREIRKFLGDLNSLPEAFHWDFRYHNVSRNNQQDGTSLGINTSGIILYHIQGDPTTCIDVIYTGDSRDPNDKDTGYVHHGWKGLSHIVNTSRHLQQTCLVYFQISSPFLQIDGKELNPVWGRLPATALIMSTFPQATILLYLDTDALPAVPDQSPTTMYNALSYDGYGDNATFQQKYPGLIVNKPFTGWLCGQCEKYGLDHGCFNTGALLWNRSSEGAAEVLQTWWESRNWNESRNFFHPEDGEPFHGWSGGTKKRWKDKMGEQNRLMYLYGTNAAIQDAVWPVPQQNSGPPYDSNSCPSAVEGHTPCLQNDCAHHESVVMWRNQSSPQDKPSCFINHFADEKELVINQTALMLHG